MSVSTRIIRFALLFLLVANVLSFGVSNDTDLDLFERDEAEIPSFRPVSSDGIEDPNPHYHPARVQMEKPVTRPPPFRPQPMHQEGITKHWYDRYVRWAINDEIATCIGLYNGHVVPRYCDSVGFHPWYLELQGAPQWENLPSGDHAYNGDRKNMPNRVREYIGNAERDSEALCTASYDRWSVPSPCYNEPGYLRKSEWTHFRISPPESKKAPLGPHYYNDPDSQLSSPYFPSPRERQENYLPGRDRCWPRRSSVSAFLFNPVPLEALRRNIFEFCDSQSVDFNSRQLVHDIDSNSQIMQYYRNVDDQLLNNRNWFKHSEYSMYDDLFVTTSFRITPNPLQDPSYGSWPQFTVNECRMIMRKAAEECNGPNEFGSGVLIKGDTGGVPVLFEVESRVATHPPPIKCT
jgi:hypothetical protein